MKNPRRAYNRDGSMVEPATVRSHLAQGQHRAEIWCNTCHHHGEVTIDELPLDLPIPDICLRYRCSACGSKNLQSRGSISEHYEKLYERTGLSHGNAPPGTGKPETG